MSAMVRIFSSGERWNENILTIARRNIHYLFYPRAGGAKRRARVLIPPGYLHPGKRKH